MVPLTGWLTGWYEQAGRACRRDGKEKGVLNIEQQFGWLEPRNEMPRPSKLAIHRGAIYLDFIFGPHGGGCIDGAPGVIPLPSLFLYLFLREITSVS